MQADTAPTDPATDDAALYRAALNDLIRIGMDAARQVHAGIMDLPPPADVPQRVAM